MNLKNKSWFTLRNMSIVLGSFILGVISVLFLFGGFLVPNGFLSTGFKSEDVKQENVEDENPGESDFFISVPGQVTKDFNWSRARVWLNNRIKVFLEGQVNGQGDWIQGNQYLNVDMEDIGNNALKSTWNFTTPVAGNYRLTVVVDADTFNVSQTDTYEYTLSLEAFNNTFSLIFNYEDLLQYSNLIFNQGRTDYNGRDVFFFRVRRDNVPANFFVSWDPSYEVTNAGNELYNMGRTVAHGIDGRLWCIYQSATGGANIEYSDDQGDTWILDHNFDLTGTDFYGSVATDSNGVCHMMYYLLDTDYKIIYSNSSDWTTTHTISSGAEHNWRHSFAIDSNDNIHMVYKEQEGTVSTYELMYINSLDNGGSWNTPKKLENEVDEADDNWDPDIAIDSSNNIHVVFGMEDYANGYDQIGHIVSTDADTTVSESSTWSSWTADVITDDSNHNQRYPKIAIDMNDTLHVVWHGVDQANGKNQIGYCSKPSGSGWNAVEYITDDSSYDQTFATVSVTQDDDVWVACTSVGDDDFTYVVNYSSSSSWSSPVKFNPIVSEDFRHMSGVYSRFPEVDNKVAGIPSSGFAVLCEDVDDNDIWYINLSVIWDTDESGGEPPVQPEYNYAPTITNLNPNNHSTNIPISGNMSANINLSSSFDFNWTIELKCNGTDQNASGLHEKSGSKGFTYSGLDYSTTYTYYVNATNTTGGGTNSSYGFFTTTSAPRSWQDFFMFEFSASNTYTQTWQDLSMFEFSASNSEGKTWQDLSMFEFSASNSSQRVWNDLSMFEFSASNTATWTDFSMFEFSASNSDSKVWNDLSMFEFSASNTYTQSWNDLSMFEFSASNSSKVVLTISNIYPSNNSYINTLRPDVYFTVNHASGQAMNYSIYSGTNLSNVTTLLTNVSSVYNGTYDYIFISASNYTDYYWRIQVVSGDVEINEYLVFTPYLSGGQMISTPGFELLLFFMSLFVAVYMFKRRKKEIV